MERRANGEGTMVKRHKKGGYYRAITLPDGKRKFIYGATKKKVVEKEVREEADDGLVSDPITIEDYLSRWLEGAVRYSVSQKTYERYEQLCRIHLVPSVGHVKVKNLTALQLQSLYSKKIASGLSPRAVNYIHRTIYKALKQGVKWGYVSHNVAEATDPPRPKKKEVNPLSREQIGILLSGLDNDRDRALYTLAISTGLRQSEILGLKWGDVDLDDGLVKSRRALSRITEGYVFVQPKSAKGRRSVGLIPRASEALKTYREERGKPDGEDLVFRNQGGGPMHPWLITKPFQKVCSRLGLPSKTRWHDLRHTAATIWLLKGVHPKVVQEALGHSTITITRDTYSHVLPNLQKAAVEAMGEA